MIGSKSRIPASLRLKSIYNSLNMLSGYCRGSAGCRFFLAFPLGVCVFYKINRKSHYAYKSCQICDAGHTKGDTCVRWVFIPAGASLQNLSNCSLLKASDRKFSSDLKCLANTRLLFTRLLRVNNRRRYMQFLQLELRLLTMETTAELSQNSIILVFLIWPPQVKIAATSAYNSRYSMLGLHCLM